ncbi:hypothetical protein QFC19_002786 [Naganishia cerealis]|uniref:Uncharacterized protein n=1 Tax=Naganishia cerealis TaxID=610337 RepID=A0ACC2W8D3_9TREE|nr:hypothetical protein QFC19_002786 [Naganishia cerealis]
MFRRPPSSDERYHYGDFDAFAFAASKLERPHRLRRPHQLKDHDIRQDEWAYFIDVLSREAFRHRHTHRSSPLAQLQPRLTKDVQELLRAWQHGYFGPRAVQVYVSENGKKVYDHGYGVPFHRAAMSMYDGRSMYTDTPTRRRGTYSDGDEGSSDESDEYDPREEARFSARERAHRREKRRRRARKRREERHAARHVLASGEWEVHFEYTAPTVFGAKPLRYGEKLRYERPL